MCEYKVLIQDHSGYVVKCGSCDRLKIAFGNIAFCMKEIDFVNLWAVLESKKEFHQNDTELRCRKIYLEIPGSHVNMVFSIEELNGFHHLLTESYMTNEINKLIQ